LRELAGGGSQTTAQRTITAWRQDLSRKLAMCVRLGAQLPDDVLQAANGMMEALWMRARDGAAQEYTQERAQHEAAQADGAARLAETHVELQQAREELGQAKGLLTSKDGQMREMRAEIAAANERLAQAARDFEQERRARSEQASQARAAQEALERGKRGLNTLLTRVSSQTPTAGRRSANATRQVVPSPGSMVAVRWLMRTTVPTTV
jgi:chromosome segregation ATPase